MTLDGWRDPLRGISKDKDFLAEHYRAFGSATRDDRDLVLDTRTFSVSLAARSVADWLLRGSE